tara:strand:+ start:9565 stop:11394 length:1830 start_codon:yes stop_codon:yes gene_type:complete
MKKTIFTTILFIVFLLFLFISFLSFFGYETNRFNKIIKSEIRENNKNINLNFTKISILLDIKNLVLFVKFIDPLLEYKQNPIPLKSLRTDINLKFLTQQKIVIKKIILSTKYLDFNKVKPLLKNTDMNEEILNYVKTAKFRIKDLKLEFDEKYNLKKDISIGGDIKSADLQISDDYEVKNLVANFLYKKNLFNLSELSLDLKHSINNEIKFLNGKLKSKKIKKNYDFELEFQTKNSSKLPRISILNYNFKEGETLIFKTKFLIKKNRDLLFKNVLIKDKNNKFFIKSLYLDKNGNLNNFEEVQVKTSFDNDTNNEFNIINKDKITVKGKVFDAKMLITELSKDNKTNNLLKRFTKDVKIDFERVLKGAKFPIKNFSLVGKIKKGSFEKIIAKSDFLENRYLDISLKNREKTKDKILEVHSDIAMPLLNEYKFFQGLEGGNLIYISKFNKKKSTNVLTVNDFKLNKAPALAKILSLADFKGLTDTLKGEGISFDTLLIKYESDPLNINVEEIFMIGPSISILIDGYIEKKSGLISLRGTMVPAKTLNNLISKIPVVGDILIGKKIGEGVFGVSFKVKGYPDNLKTTVNPVKTLTPRFITRALENAKKKEN